MDESIIRKMKKTILTGDRPTGRLHLGHYVGSLKRRVQLQNTGDYETFIMIADAQALTDNFDSVDKIRENVIEVVLDYLSCGLDPSKSTIFVQSHIPELTELTFYYLNLVTLARLQRNPTVKSEIKSRGFNESLPVGFLTYPVSQAADITLFNGTVVPVGSDQLPMIEQTRELVRSFNSIYGDVFAEPKELLPEDSDSQRLPGIDGKAKMSKSLQNAIYLADTTKELEKKVMKMFTDPNHLQVSDPGNVDVNTVFTYLDVFSTQVHFDKYLTDYENLDALKNHYKQGGLGDVKVKRFLIKVLNDVLAPIREKRKYYENRIDEVYNLLEEGTKEARLIGMETIKKVRNAMGIEYFNDEKLINRHVEKYSE